MDQPYLGSSLPEPDQINRVNSDYQAVTSLNEAMPWQLYGDHGHAPSLQSWKAFWIYEAAGPAKVCPLTKLKSM